MIVQRSENMTAPVHFVRRPAFRRGKLFRSVLASAGLAVLAASLFAAPKPAAAAEEAALLSTCTFNLAALKAALDTNDNAVPAANLEVSYIVVYTRQNPHGGQFFDPPGQTPPTYTGPVFCINDDGSEEVVADAESVQIPGPNHPDVDSIDIVENQEAMRMSIELNDTVAPLSGHDGAIENRYCQSSGGTVDCVLVREPW